MKSLKLVLIGLIFLSTSCKNRTLEDNHYSKEILQLVTDDSKKQFLENVLEDDQRVRDNERSAHLMLTYGKGSPQHMEYVQAQWKQDEINLKKIEEYLEVHGYPKKELGKEATLAPWMVIHHAQGYEVRERNFKEVYGAFLNGDIDDGAISFYLGRMYQIKCGKRLDMESPYRAEDEINQLIQELDLEEMKANVEQRVHNLSEDD